MAHRVASADVEVETVAHPKHGTEKEDADKSNGVAVEFEVHWLREEYRPDELALACGKPGPDHDGKHLLVPVVPGLDHLCPGEHRVSLVALWAVHLVIVSVEGGEAALGHWYTLPGEHGLVDDGGASEEHCVTVHEAPRGGDHHHVPWHQLAVANFNLR